MTGIAQDTAQMSRDVAVVVGATGAFGRVIVARLQQAGLCVVAVARTAKALAALEAEFPGLVPCQADISEDSSIAAIAASLPGPVRMVVHGPGVVAAGGIMSIAPGGLVDAVNIKVAGFVRLVRAVDEKLLPQARLVAIGGHYGLEPTAYAAAAGIANAALLNVVRQFSLGYGPRGITAHMIAPGPADTARLRRVAADRAAMASITTEDVLDELKAESSLGAFTTPEQVAWAVTTLLASEADAMTGSTLMLDAGRRRGLP